MPGDSTSTLELSGFTGLGQVEASPASRVSNGDIDVSRDFKVTSSNRSEAWSEYDSYKSLKRRRFRWKSRWLIAGGAFVLVLSFSLAVACWVFVFVCDAHGSRNNRLILWGLFSQPFAALSVAYLLVVTVHTRMWLSVAFAVLNFLASFFTAGKCCSCDTSKSVGSVAALSVIFYWAALTVSHWLVYRRIKALQVAMCENLGSIWLLATTACLSLIVVVRLGSFVVRIVSGEIDIISDSKAMDLIPQVSLAPIAISECITTYAFGKAWLSLKVVKSEARGSQYEEVASRAFNSTSMQLFGVAFARANEAFVMILLVMHASYVKNNAVADFLRVLVQALLHITNAACAVALSGAPEGGNLVSAFTTAITEVIPTPRKASPQVTAHFDWGESIGSALPPMRMDAHNSDSDISLDGSPKGNSPPRSASPQREDTKVKRKTTYKPRSTIRLSEYPGRRERSNTECPGRRERSNTDYLERPGRRTRINTDSSQYSARKSKYSSHRESSPHKRKRANTASYWTHSPDWDHKVAELAGRGFTVEALLQFFGGLGKNYMQHYQAASHTTNDVVRQAIIPLSKDMMCAYSDLMMEGAHRPPQRFVTHNWANLFRDLVAAIIADALDEPNFGIISYFLARDVKTVLDMVKSKGTLQLTYWVCALCVSQHDCICASNYDEVDSVTKIRHPICDCGKPKVFNTTPPTNTEGKSIECELNKFDDMIHYLAALDTDFAQVIAVDVGCKLFGRAWCIAEIAKAHELGIEQRLKLSSQETLDKHEEDLSELRIQDMKASRLEDVTQILSSIPDVDLFNERLQQLIFDDTGLLANWRTLDVEDRMRVAGRLVLWQQRSRSRRSVWFPPLERQCSRRSIRASIRASIVSRLVSGGRRSDALLEQAS